MRPLPAPISKLVQPSPAAELRRTARPRKRRKGSNLRRSREISALPQFLGAAAVVAQPRRVQGQVHESLETKPAAGRGRFAAAHDRAGACCARRRRPSGDISRRLDLRVSFAGHGIQRSEFRVRDQVGIDHRRSARVGAEIARTLAHGRRKPAHSLSILGRPRRLPWRMNSTRGARTRLPFTPRIL